jgi:signal transduction histidine kinase
MTWARIPERWKLTIVLAAAAVLLLAGIGMAAYNEEQYRSEKVRDVSVQAQILAASVSAALAFDDTRSTQEYVDALAANPEVEAVAVHDVHGELAASFNRPGPAAPSDIVVQRLVTEHGIVLGKVYLRSTTEPAVRRLTRFGGVVLMVVMASMLVAVLGAAQAQLRRANRELEDRAAELQVQMEEREKAEEALRQSQKMEAIGQLTGGIAHDFNNLLQAVHGALDLIRRKPQDVERVKRWAEGGLQAAERGAKLTSQLLAFSRFQQLELRALVVNDLLTGLQDLLTRTLGPSVELGFDLDGGRGAVMADATQLELAVLNLAINARDAMPSGGVLTISTRPRHVERDAELEPGDYLELCVTDTGVGMAQHVVDRAFDPFFTTKGVGKGTGLGLSQVYGIARQAGGTVRIESAPGAGTRIILFLKCAEGEVEPPDARVAEAAPVPVRDAKILVIDDDPDVRQFLCASLEGLGYDVVEAADGVAGLTMLDLEAPDLMLVDFAMPGMNGAEVAEAARARRPGLPILFASGYADIAAVEAAVTDVARMLRKPFSLNELAAAVETALERAET